MNGATNIPNSLSAAYPQANEIRRLLAKAKSLGSPDAYVGKRIGSRFRAEILLELTTDPATGSLINATLHNISNRGMAVWTRQPFAAHQPVFIREFMEGHTPNWIKGIVRHCGKGLRGYLLGIEFEQKLGPTLTVEPRISAS